MVVIWLMVVLTSLAQKLLDGATIVLDFQFGLAAHVLETDLALDSAEPRHAPYDGQRV